MNGSLNGASHDGSSEQIFRNGMTTLCTRVVAHGFSETNFRRKSSGVNPLFPVSSGSQKNYLK